MTTAGRASCAPSNASGSGASRKRASIGRRPEARRGEGGAEAGLVLFAGRDRSPQLGGVTGLRLDAGASTYQHVPPRVPLAPCLPPLPLLQDGDLEVYTGRASGLVLKAEKNSRRGKKQVEHDGRVDGEGPGTEDFKAVLRDVLSMMGTCDRGRAGGEKTE